MRREIGVEQHRDARRAGMDRHPQHRDEHQHRAEQRVEEELVARVNPVSAAPDADDQIHRDQPGLEEHVEQEQILRRERADHQQLGDQERAHIFGHALGDRLPAGADADRHQEHAEHDQHQREAVDSQCPVEAAEQRHEFLKLPLRAADVVIRPQHDAEREIDQRCCQRQPARAIGAEEQAHDRRDGGNREHDGKDWEAVHCIISVTPAKTGVLMGRRAPLRHESPAFAGETKDGRKLMTPSPR